MRKQLLRQMKRGQEGQQQNQMQQMMQAQMARMQEELAGQTVEGEAGQGAVKVTVNGQREPIAVKIDPAAVDPDDMTLLEDLVLTAMKNALAAAQELEQEQVQKMTAGLLPPGMLPGL